MITSSQIRNSLVCPHRVSMDAVAAPSLRDPVSPFVQMLWASSADHRQATIPSLGITTDLTAVSVEDKERATLDAMRRGDALIHGGRISAAGLLAEPSLLERRGSGYLPGDIKSGRLMEGDDEFGSDAKVKKEYVLPIVHAVNVLEQAGFSDGSREAFILDRDGKRMPLYLGDQQGSARSASWWDCYEATLATVQGVVGRSVPSRAALSAHCKQCHWKSACRSELLVAGDLSLVAALGRSKRDVMQAVFPNIEALAASDPETYVTCKGKKTIFPGIGPATLRKYQARAKLLVTDGAKPYLKAPVSIPVNARQVMFDVEDDPIRGFCYLFGFVERLHEQPETATFLPQFAETFDAVGEEAAFAKAWAYLNARAADSTIFHYSAYERTALRGLAGRYPWVCSVVEVDDLFDKPNVVDLFAIVRTCTEWPLHDQSIKSIAKYLGFTWRDSDPSGAASIEWFHQFTETGDPAHKQRILTYNEDDCLATAVVLDGINALRPNAP